MDLKEILQSGILELYVLGQLDSREIEQVQSYIQQYPELKEEIKSIENAFRAIGDSASEPTSRELKQSILQKAKGTPRNVHKPPRITTILALISTAAMIAALLLWNHQRQNNVILNQELQKLQASCDSVQTSSEQLLALYQELNRPENDILAFEATPKYQNTKLYFHTNPSTAKNFIQVLDLPEINSDQIFQLWSLKEGQDPMPLDLFDGSTDLVEVNFIPGTNAYAITIEQAGGSEVPNLDQLIGIVNLAS